MIGRVCCIFFFFNDTATTEIYTLSLHDALPIYMLDTDNQKRVSQALENIAAAAAGVQQLTQNLDRSEEHTSELQSPCNLVCRLLLEKKNKQASRPVLNHDGVRAPYLSALIPILL